MKMGMEARLVLLADNNLRIIESIVVCGNQDSVLKKMLDWKSGKGKVTGYRECYGINMETHISRCYVSGFDELPSVKDNEDVTHFAIKELPHYILGICGTKCDPRQIFLQ